MATRETEESMEIKFSLSDDPSSVFFPTCTQFDTGNPGFKHQSIQFDLREVFTFWQRLKVVVFLPIYLVMFILKGRVTLK